MGTACPAGERETQPNRRSWPVPSALAVWAVRGGLRKKGTPVRVARMVRAALYIKSNPPVPTNGAGKIAGSPFFAKFLGPRGTAVRRGRRKGFPTPVQAHRRAFNPSTPRRGGFAGEGPIKCFPLPLVRNCRGCVMPFRFFGTLFLSRPL